MAESTTAAPKEIILITCQIELAVTNRRVLLESAWCLPGFGKKLETEWRRLAADRPDMTEIDINECEMITALQEVLLDSARNSGMELHSTCLEITDWYVKDPLFDETPRLLN